MLQNIIYPETVLIRERAVSRRRRILCQYDLRRVGKPNKNGVETSAIKSNKAIEPAHSRRVNAKRDERIRCASKHVSGGNINYKNNNRFELYIL